MMGAIGYYNTIFTINRQVDKKNKFIFALTQDNANINPF